MSFLNLSVRDEHVTGGASRVEAECWIRCGLTASRDGRMCSACPTPAGRDPDDSHCRSGFPPRRWSLGVLRDGQPAAFSELLLDFSNDRIVWMER